MSELLSQNVNLIYEMIRSAVKSYRQGDSYEGLQELGFAGALMYLDEKHDELDKIDSLLMTINSRVMATKANSEEETNATRVNTANELSNPHFYATLKTVRDYMQRVGYYQMMNKNWHSFYDLSEGRKSE